MAEKFCLASHGLLIGWPVDELAAWLNANTPVGIHFVVVGDLDPQPEESTIIQSLLGAAAAGKDLVIVGRSKGAMLMFYLADALKAQSIRVKLVASIDPTDWGSNAPGTIKWAVVLDGNAGQWLVPDNADVWLNFYQDSPPEAASRTSRLGMRPRTLSSITLERDPPLYPKRCDDAEGDP
jgi:hypothetical protein